MKLLSKSLITIFTLSLLTQSLSAKTTICYKKNWTSPSTIENTKLEGGECNSNSSYTDMLQNDWFLKDIKISKGDNGLNYTYLLTDEKLITIDNSKFMDNKKAKLNYKSYAIRITNVNEEEATINIGNLKVGQSAIIQHNYSNGKTLIVSNAYVTFSNSKNSKLKFYLF
jgi:hypothetical protein